MKTFLTLIAITAGLILTSSQVANAEETQHEGKIAFKFDNGDITTMIATYAKATGRQFIVDPGVRGKITVLVPSEVTVEEAYNILAESLAINGFTLIEEGDTTIVKASRNAQRDMIPTVTKLPPIKPNRMITMIFKPKYISVEELNKRLRILPSKDGEMTPFEPTNSLIVSDYAANINRISEIINQLDTPQSAQSAKAKPAQSVQPAKDQPQKSAQPTHKKTDG